MNQMSRPVHRSLYGPALLAAVLSPLLALACGDKDDTGGGTLPPAAVAGSYQVTIGGVTGCEGDVSWVDGWASGPLQIDQVEGAAEIVLDFGGGYIFDGSVDSYGRYFFSGDVPFNDAELAVENQGAFTVDPDFEGERWKVEGEFTIEVDDDEFETNNCTLTSPMVAVELVDL